MNAVLPDGLGSGPQPVVLTIGTNDNSQQQAMVWINDRPVGRPRRWCCVDTGCAREDSVAGAGGRQMAPFVPAITGDQTGLLGGEEPH